jgi:LacI family transcriptional regulator
MKKKNVLLVLETSRASCRGVLRGASRYAIEQGDWIIQVEDRGLLELPSSWLKAWKGDGIIARSTSSALAKALQSKKVPMVELLGNGKQAVAEVRTDEDIVAKMAVEHFAQAGFTNFAFFAIGNAWWSELRREAFCREVAARRGNVFVFPFASSGKRTFYPIWEPRHDTAVRRWLHRLPRPIGLWATSDVFAVRLIASCHSLDIAVPEDVAILGTANETFLCNALTPTLSSIDLNSFQSGYIAAERLAQKMSGKTLAEPQALVTPLGVVARQSTDIVACHDRRIAAAVRFIRANAMSKINVDDIARFVDMPWRTLHRLFQSQLGRTIGQEIVNTRMERAKRLLIETDFSLSAIAIKIGYATTAYFVQAFRRELGLTPRQYRQENR